MMRRWINELNDYLSQSQRQQLKQEAQENGFQMVKKYKDSQGVTRVWGAYWFPVSKENSMTSQDFKSFKSTNPFERDIKKGNNKIIP
jgi:hypothetical protein